jgi:hypothetical protein
MLPDSSSTSLASLAAVFAPVAGEERSEQLVRDAARELGIVHDPLRDGEVEALLASLSKKSGVIGAAARLAASRRAVGEKTPTGPESLRRRDAQTVHGLPRVELVKLLAHALGWEKSEKLVNKTARKLRLAGDVLTRDAALAILSALEEESGAVGTTARFAKARAILRF